MKLMNSKLHVVIAAVVAVGCHAQTTNNVKNNGVTPREYDVTKSLEHLQRVRRALVMGRTTKKKRNLRGLQFADPVEEESLDEDEQLPAGEVGVGVGVGTGVGTGVGSVPLYDAEDPWTSFAGYNVFSVPQYFDQSLTDAMFGPEALERAKTFVKEGTWLYCGDENDPYSFIETLQDPPVKGTARFQGGACGDNEEANKYVDQGLTLRYAFNDNEAICSYRAAQAIAPDCALAFLFEALSAGPNVNYATITSPLAYLAVLQAMQKAAAILEPVLDQPAYEKVVDFYNALILRYVPQGQTIESMLAITSDTDRLNRYSSTYDVNSGLYAGAMIDIHNKYPDDNDLGAVAVGALMQSPSWRWWQPGSEYQLDDDTVDSVDASPIRQTYKQNPNATRAYTILQEVLARDPDHLGANHYMIHNIEMGPNPEWLLGVADRIFDIDPEDGHITHMASHVYSRMGYHDKVYEMNKIANKLDFEWNVKRTGGGLMTTLYKYEPHNIEFNVVAGWDSGNFAEAAAHVALLDQLSIFRLTANPSLGSLQYPLTFGIQLALQFGLWERIVDDTADDGPSPFGPGGNITLLDGQVIPCGQCFTWVKFAQTIALARLGRVQEAEAALNFFLYNVTGVNTAGLTVSDKLATFAEQMFAENSANVDVNSAQATGTLTINNDDKLRAVRALVANAEVLRAKNLREEAKGEYKTAWDYQKLLQYDEPSPFFVPIAETLGGYLLQEESADAAAEAADLFRDVLFVHPMAIRSVLGLQVALQQQDSFTGRNDAASIEYLVTHVLQSNDTAIDVYDL